MFCIFAAEGLVFDIDVRTNDVVTAPARCIWQINESQNLPLLPCLILFSDCLMKSRLNFYCPYVTVFF